MQASITAQCGQQPALGKRVALPGLQALLGGRAGLPQRGLAVDVPGHEAIQGPCPVDGAGHAFSGVQGDLVGAMRWFERNRTACGPPGLLSEEFDVRQRQLRGNLPQAFVHAVLLESAVRLGAAL